MPQRQTVTIQPTYQQPTARKQGTAPTAYHQTQSSTAYHQAQSSTGPRNPYPARATPVSNPRPNLRPTNPSRPSYTPQLQVVERFRISSSSSESSSSTDTPPRREVSLTSSESLGSSFLRVPSTYTITYRGPKNRTSNGELVVKRAKLVKDDQIAFSSLPLFATPLPVKRRVRVSWLFLLPKPRF